VRLSFDYSTLPQEYPRRFVPARLNFDNWSEVQQVFQSLENRPIHSQEELEKWLEDESEFYSAFYEIYALRYARMTCQTDDPEREKAFLHFVEEIEPKAKPLMFALDNKFLQTPARKYLPDRFYVLDRRRANDVTLFRPENVELEKDETRFAQQFEKIAGARTVWFEGKERTLQQMSQYLENVNRDVRQATWSLAEERRLKDRKTMDQLYSDLLTVRQKIAKNAGFDNYRDYAFRKRERFDYTPQDCFRFHEAVEQHIVPLIHSLDKERSEALGVGTLRPWDLAVDVRGRAPLEPFNTIDELMQRCSRVYQQLGPRFDEDFHKIVKLALIDPDSRRGKAPGGYCLELPEVRLPFIFLNLVGRDGDMRTILHESGHAFHTFATRNLSLHFHYRGESAPIEFAEVASMSMELLGGEHIEGVFYNHEDAIRSKREHLEEIIRLLAWVATIDAFQHWIYTHPDHTVEEREQFWLTLWTRFRGKTSWDGFSEVERSYWQRQGHLFTSPFYYIEYAIAQLGALGIWTQYRKDPKAAIEAYVRALALGGSKPLPKLFEAAGLPFDFGPQIVHSYAQELASELRSLR
jgi:oligoendopeptidase F